MFKSNKGAVNLTILIVSIVVGVLILGTVAGIIIWKVLGEEDSGRRSRDRNDNGLKDCGVSDIFLNPTHMDMFNADFEQDDVFVCMGKNIKNNCRDSISVVKADDFDITFKVSGTSKSDCEIRLEIYDDDDNKTYYVECPLPGLISLPDISSDYKKFEDKFSQGPGNYAAGLFLMTFDVADRDWDIGREILGCTGNFD